MLCLWAAAPLACGGDEFANAPQCQPGYKVCGGKCVYASASYGCSASACDPCPAPDPALKHTIASCDTSGQCSTTCETGFGLCGADPAVGCDTNLQDNAHHCGWCKHDCDGALCDKGICAPIVLASGQKNPSALTFEGSYLYWVNADDDGAVMRAPVDGGAAEVLASGEKQPYGLALSQENAFFSAQTNGGEVRSVPLAGGASVTVATDTQQPQGLARIGQNLYWASKARGEILSVSIAEAGETPKPIKSGLVEPTHVTASSNGWLVYSAVGGTEVYCHRSGENLRIITGLVPGALATLGDEVYMARAEARGVYHKSCEANLADSPKYVPGSQGATAIALDEASLYFTSAQGVMQVPLDGGDTPVVHKYSTITTASSIAVGKGLVFVADPATGTILRVTK